MIIVDLREPRCASVIEAFHGVSDQLNYRHRHQSIIWVFEAERAAAIGTDVDAIYSSPALRCRQTVQPLADAARLPVLNLPELLDTHGFAEPRQWTDDLLAPIGQAVGGAWTAGQALRALVAMVYAHPAGRVVAASHGDVIPAFFAALCALADRPLPAIPDRGGWYTVRFTGDGFVVDTHGEVWVPPGRH